MIPAHISYRPGVLHLLDQTQLPAATIFLELRTLPEVAGAIKALRVRGAPAIGITAAYAMAIEAHELAGQSLDADAFLERLEQAAAGLIAVRPTAVNLSWAVHRQLSVAQEQQGLGASLPAIAAVLDGTAEAIHREDIESCKRIGDHGAVFLMNVAGDGQVARRKLTVLTHCNTGDLATGGYGTALGVIRSLWKRGNLERVFVDETRPVLQGARLTTWELQQDAIPHTLLTDSMAAHFMQRGEVDAIVVGADRIARNGDVANKIGTYALALAANAHDLPFVVAAPLSTFDAGLASGAEIVIEQRNPNEVTSFAGARFAPNDTEAANPAFDVTPAQRIDAIVTERGAIEPPYESAIAALLQEPAMRVRP